MMTMFCIRRLASSIDARATSTGSPTPLPGDGAKTGTPARSPRTCSCCTALGRCRSAATIIGVFPCWRSHRASLAATDVLPVPWSPASMITVGGTLANRSRRASPPRISTSSSLTILMTCCAGLRASETSAPDARSLTRAMNCRTTGSATSASSSAILISRVVASMSAADSRPCPRRDEKTLFSRSESVSNTSGCRPRAWPVGHRARAGRRAPARIAWGMHVALALPQAIRSAAEAGDGAGGGAGCRGSRRGRSSRRVPTPRRSAAARRGRRAGGCGTRR